MNKDKSAPDNQPWLEAILENAEAAVDLIATSEVLAAVPVVSTAFNVMRGVNDMRARANMAKLARFVTDPSLQCEESKAALRTMAADGGPESQKIGETLFLILDRLTDMEKPALLAKVFAGYLCNKISREELLRLAPAIDAAFIDDLHALRSAKEPFDRNQFHWMQTLVVAWLTEQGVPGPVGGVQVYHLTSLGRALRKALTE
jgi:hypothetical protein